MKPAKSMIKKTDLGKMSKLKSLNRKPKSARESVRFLVIPNLSEAYDREGRLGRLMQRAAFHRYMGTRHDTSYGVGDSIHHASRAHELVRKFSAPKGSSARKQSHNVLRIMRKASGGSTMWNRNVGNYGGHAILRKKK